MELLMQFLPTVERYIIHICCVLLLNVFICLSTGVWADFHKGSQVNVNKSILLVLICENIATLSDVLLKIKGLHAWIPLCKVVLRTIYIWKCVSNIKQSWQSSVNVKFQYRKCIYSIHLFNFRFQNESCSVEKLRLILRADVFPISLGSLTAKLDVK